MLHLPSPAEEGLAAEETPAADAAAPPTLAVVASDGTGAGAGAPPAHITLRVDGRSERTADATTATDDAVPHIATGANTPVSAVLKAAEAAVGMDLDSAVLFIVKTPCNDLDTIGGQLFANGSLYLHIAYGRRSLPVTVRGCDFSALRRTRLPPGDPRPVPEEQRVPKSRGGSDILYNKYRASKGGWSPAEYM